jgi:hypothetical protein
MGLLVNKFQPSGSGKPNDGNAARIFLKKYGESARITGVNESPILRL